MKFDLDVPPVRSLRLGDSTTAAVAGLVAVNLVPLVGVVALGWSLHELLVIYWLENGIVGAYNLPKMLLAGSEGHALPVDGESPGVVDRTDAPADGPTVDLGNVLLAGFFCFHYGIFWIVHGVFVWTFPEFAPAMEPVSARSAGPIALGTVGLVVGHGVSFWTNFLRGGEWRAVTPTDRMNAPYSRVLVLHLTIIFGAFVVAMIGAPVGALVVMIVLKTWIDLRAHVREHRRDAPASA